MRVLTVFKYIYVVSGNTQQGLTQCTYCSYDNTNVSGINLTTGVILDNSSNTSLADKNCDIPCSSTGTSDNPVDAARPKDAKACRRFRKLFRKRIHRDKGHLKSVSNHARMNFSNADLTPATISLLSKGPSFVPTPKHIDWGKLSKDFLKFKNKMRWQAKYGNQEADIYMKMTVMKKFSAVSNYPQVAMPPGVRIRHWNYSLNLLEMIFSIRLGQTQI